MAEIRNLKGVVRMQKEILTDSKRKLTIEDFFGSSGWTITCAILAAMVTIGSVFLVLLLAMVFMEDWSEPRSWLLMLPMFLMVRLLTVDLFGACLDRVLQTERLRRDLHGSNLSEYYDRIDCMKFFISEARKLGYGFGIWFLIAFVMMAGKLQIWATVEPVRLIVSAIIVVPVLVTVLLAIMEAATLIITGVWEYRSAK